MSSVNLRHPVKLSDLKVGDRFIKMSSEDVEPDKVFEVVKFWDDIVTAAQVTSGAQRSLPAYTPVAMVSEHDRGDILIAPKPRKDSMPLKIEDDLVPLSSLETGELFIQEQSRIDPDKVFQVVGKGDGRISACHLASDNVRWFSTSDFVHKVEPDD